MALLMDRSTSARVARWAYRPAAEGRDLRLDLLRGFAVFAMVVDHFGGQSWLTLITGGNEFLVSAAEGFVFISGLVMGTVYGRRIARVGWIAATEAIVRRAALLYWVTVGLTLLFVGLFAFTNLRLWFDRAYGLGLTDPVELVVGTLTLHYTYHGTDILWMYTVLVAASPLLLHLIITGRTAYLLLGSTLLWLAYQVFPAQAAIPWVAGNAVNFPVAAWQLYFVVGLVLGCQRDRLAERLEGLPRWSALALSALCFLGLVLLDWGHASGRIATWPLLNGLAGDAYHQIFDKPSVAWGRVVALAIAASFFFLLVNQLWRPIRRLTGWLLIPLGQRALLAYSLHLVVLVVIYNLDLWGLYDRSRIVNTLLQAAAVGCVWGLVKSWDRFGVLAHRFEALLEAQWRPRRRIGLAVASAAMVGLVATTALLFGPVRSSRPAQSAEEVDSAGTLVYVPESASDEAPSRILLVLRSEFATGPATASTMVGAARDAGWIVVAPTLEYGVWNSENDVRAAALRLMPSLRTLVDQLDTHVERPTHARVFVLGSGRGGQLAHMLALVHPELVRAVASVGAVPCTLPVESSEPRAGGVPRLFPAGLSDVAIYAGQPADFELLSKISFWIQPQPNRPDRPLQECGWLERPVEASEQVIQYASLLRGLGAEVEIVSGTDDPDQPWRRALRFFDQLAGE